MRLFKFAQKVGYLYYIHKIICNINMSQGHAKLQGIVRSQTGSPEITYVHKRSRGVV